ncbi:Ribose methyltransferase [Coemansia aciculifera]|uniref:Ribose methyltransferase n=1 Tax=Coemansia aciculifera TaxID=417176 RepID=A0ACC1M5K7_9FUNG|nr:Ribose methyltransferase [Coemansia aciculifera]
MFAPRANAHLCSKLRISTGSLSSHRCYAYVRPNPVVTPGKAPKPKHGHPVKLKFKTKGSRGITLANTNMELLYGNSPIRAALQQGRREIYGLYYQGGFMGDEPRTEMNELISMAKAQAVPVTDVSKSDMTAAIYGANHQGILLKVSRTDAARLRQLGPLVNGRYSAELATGVVELEPRRKFPLLVCLEGIQDERNLGSIIRTALFFGADGVLMSGRDACRPSPIVSKTSAGAMECLAMYRSDRLPVLLSKARQNGWSVVCTAVRESANGSDECSPLDRISNLSGPTLLVLGSEGRGVTPALQDLSDIDVHIPMRSDIPSYIDSLNVGVAAGVILSALKFAGE